jgi:hypothetical protein
MGETLFLGDRINKLYLYILHKNLSGNQRFLRGSKKPQANRMSYLNDEFKIMHLDQVQNRLLGVICLHLVRVGGKVRFEGVPCALILPRFGWG